ncbi:MAG: sterol desaturase family protein [Candidatus Dormibacteria bacterium]
MDAAPTAAPTAAAGGTTLRGAARVFWGYGSPRLMAAVVVAAIAARMVAGHWSDGDLIAAAIVLALDPFVEWVFHVGGLHMKPFAVRGRTVDPLFARRHRMHHRDPREVWLVFVPLPVLAGLLAVILLIGGLAVPYRPIGLTVIATAATILLAYEWIHYLIHSRYVPRTRLYRAVWRSHTLHHYKNEQYWFGVTNPIGDLVLRTYPKRDAVPTSPTARTLGVEDETALLQPV